MACMAGERGSPRMLRAPKDLWAELHPSLKPADDFAVGQKSGDMIKQFGFVGKVLPSCTLPG